MNIEDLTVKQIREIGQLFAGVGEGAGKGGLVGKYVIVRCCDAGVHAGILESYTGRECILLESRRLWYWKPADKKSFLSGVAVAGLDSASKTGAPVPRLLLTENCEVIECTDTAMKSIRGSAEHEQ